AAYERGGIRKMRRTPVHSLTHNVGDRRVFWHGSSCCTAWAWSSFVSLFQEVSSTCKTRNQLNKSVSGYYHAARAMASSTSQLLMSAKAAASVCLISAQVLRKSNSGCLSSSGRLNVT